MSLLTNRALDIELSDEELCEAIGYLATPGRMRIEAQVPYGKEERFEREYPGQRYDKMLPSSDKQSFQLRIMLKNRKNCPAYLEREITAGGGNNTPGCISRGRFVERLVGEFGFRFSTDCQDVNQIRDNIQRKLPGYLSKFDDGYNIPME